MERPIALSKLERRIIDISFKHKLSHLSSNLTAVSIIDGIYLSKQDKDPFVLCNGHAGLALYVVLEKTYGLDAEELFLRHGVHPSRELSDRIGVSTGSLGQGLPIAVGMALADNSRTVYALTSDGDLAEGSNWEALRIASDRRLENLRVAVNANGTSALGSVDVDLLDTRLQMFYPALVVKSNMYKYPDWLQGVDGHYAVLNKQQYEEIVQI